MANKLDATRWGHGVLSSDKTTFNIVSTLIFTTSHRPPLPPALPSSNLLSLLDSNPTNMPKLENFSYLFEETVTAVNDYYDFLTKVYIDESRILPSPEGGWPEITPERLKDLGKTDEVIKLLQYMP
jgi:hypothetical protein